MRVLRVDVRANSFASCFLRFRGLGVSACACTTVHVGVDRRVVAALRLITRRGFWLVAALSKYTSGLPCTSSFRMGNCARISSTLKADFTAEVELLMGSYRKGRKERKGECNAS